MNANELDQFIKNNSKSVIELQETIRQQQAEIEHLKQLFGCDPAYFEPDTHPVKELTDEEIMDYVEAFSMDMGNVYEFQSDNVLQMIRAILDKAQEK